VVGPRAAGTISERAEVPPLPHIGAASPAYCSRPLRRRLDRTPGVPARARSFRKCWSLTSTRTSGASGGRLFLSAYRNLRRLSNEWFSSMTTTMCWIRARALGMAIGPHWPGEAEDRYTSKKRPSAFPRILEPFCSLHLSYLHLRRQFWTGIARIHTKARNRHKHQETRELRSAATLASHFAFEEKGEVSASHRVCRNRSESLERSPDKNPGTVKPASFLQVTTDRLLVSLYPKQEAREPVSLR